MHYLYKMVVNEQIANETASLLLKIEAVKLNHLNPFTWASGLKSPIYCDNRVILSYPSERNKIAESFAQLVKEYFKHCDVIAGVATGAIAHGILVAEKLQKPFVYIRSSPKEHGLGNLIEGRIEKGSRVLVIEDLISTGKSSLKAVDALLEQNCKVDGMLSIFDYGFDMAQQKFEQARLPLYSLCNYDVLISQALKTNYISSDAHSKLISWRKDPENWFQSIQL